MVFDLCMSWDRLACVSSRILIPVMFSAMPDKDATHAFDFSDEFFALHAN